MNQADQAKQRKIDAQDKTIERLEASKDQNLAQAATEKELKHLYEQVEDLQRQKEKRNATNQRVLKNEEILKRQTKKY